MRTNYLGQVTLQPGDVVRLFGYPYVVDFVNDCRARCVPLHKTHVRAVTRFNGMVEFDVPGKPVNITRTIDPGEVVERNGAKWLADFNASKKAGGVGAVKADETNQEQNGESMGRKSRKSLSDKPIKHPRGGLAADAKAEKKTRVKASNGSKRVTIMGESMCAVLFRLGKEGVSVAHAKAIMKAQGAKATDSTVTTHIYLGKAGKRDERMAKITKAQVEELKASAPEPSEQPAAVAA